MHGVVKRYVPEKSIGFIEGEDGKDYFFYLRHSAGNGLVGMSAVFDPSLNERGCKAERVEILENVRTLAVPGQVLVLPLGSTLSHGKVALADTDCWIWTDFHKSRADARDILTHLAKEAGANVLFDVDYVAGQGRRGNYVYTTHGYKARMGVMGVVSPKGERMDQSRVHQIASAPERCVACHLEENRRRSSAARRQGKVVSIAGLAAASLGCGVSFALEAAGVPAAEHGSVTMSAFLLSLPVIAYGLRRWARAGKILSRGPYFVGRP